MDQSINTELLSADTVGDYLLKRKLIRSQPDSVDVLAGGISNIVLAVRSGATRVAVKQSLERLVVSEEWLAPVERAISEATAMLLLREVTPEAIPMVVAQDEANHTIVIELAPDNWTDWKSQLMRGVIDTAVASRLGVTLAAWHSATYGADLADRFVDDETFNILRIDPYYRTAATRMPETAAAMAALIDEMNRRRVCLIHGDFSPKNVLVGPPPSQWVIDFEVAYRGDPAFDLAFMISHLMMKSIHRPNDADGFDRCVIEFVKSYRVHALAELDPSVAHVASHVGALLLSRVIGKSRAEYLTDDDRKRVRSLGWSLLRDPPTDWIDLMARRDERRR